MRIFCCLLFVLASLGSTYPAFAQRSDRIGLFIGNASYPDASAPLTTIKDARVLADEFGRLSFETDIKENVKKDEMQRAIEAFLAKLGKDSIAVLYFGGYGLQVGRQNYLVPVNAEIRNESDVKRDGISVESIVAEMDRKGAKAKIIIVDAAYRNPFEQRFRSVPAGLSALDSPTGTLVIYSTGLGRVANGASGENSLLVSELIKALRAPARPAELVFHDTRRGVSRASNNEQIPWVASSLVDEFTLGQTQTAQQPPAPPPPAPPVPDTPRPPAPPVPDTPPPVPDTPRPPPPPPVPDAPRPAPPALVDGPRRPFVGLNFRFSTNADAERANAGARRGAFVVSVPPNTPAAAVGIRADDLILRANGENINKSEDLTQTIRATPVGGVIRFTLFRNLQDEELWVKPISLEEGAKRGVVSAMTALGTIYRLGEGVQRDYAEARNWFEKAAAEKDPDAMTSLGVMHRDGEGVPRDYTQAREWMEKAAALNYAFAMYSLGQMFANATGVKRDLVHARDWYEKAAQRNSAPAMYELGLIYENGDGVTAIPSRAVAWYEKAAALGNEDAKKALARLNTPRPPPPPVPDTPRPPPPPAIVEGPRRGFTGLNFRFSTNADAERVKAGARRGAFVVSVSPNAPAAEAGIRADDLVLRANGENINKMEDLSRAIRATPVREVVRLSLFRNGQDEEVWVRPISVEEAAQRGVVSAMRILGTIYRLGEGVQRDYAEARKWFEKAAAEKDTFAMGALGVMYRDAEGVPRDYTKAREWMEKAAALNYAFAMYSLGRMYQNATGVKRDLLAARDWYEKAAQRNSAPAMYELGVMYENGDGITASRSSAFAWYEKAAAAGNEDAQKALARLR